MAANIIIYSLGYTLANINICKTTLYRTSPRTQMMRFVEQETELHERKKCTDETKKIVGILPLYVTLLRDS